MALDPQTITWDPAPQPVQPGNRQGGVIITDPTVMTEEARADRSDARDEIRTGIAVRGEGRAEIADEQALRKEFRALPAVAEFQTAARSYAGALNTAPNASGDYALVVAYAKMLDPASVVREGETASVSSADSTIGRSIARLQKEFGIDGGGELSPALRAKVRREMRNLAEQYSSAYDQARSEYDSLAQSYGYPAERIVGPHLLDPYREEIDAYWAANPEDVAAKADNPLTGEGGEFLTAEDRALQKELSAAYNGGAPIEQLQAITAKYNRTFPVSTQEALDEARSQGRAINVRPSGRRDASALGAAADSPVGAYAIGAANALLSGGMDELAPILGLDPDLTQAAKEQLREQYPVSSFVGEVSGQALQMAGAAKALGAAGMGARGAAATAEIGGGAAYGAGESNDNRLLGAGVGAGGAAAGRKLGDMISSRLATPEAQSAIAQVAQDAGVPEAEVTRVLRELAQQPPQAASEAAGETVSDAVSPVSEAAQQEVATLARQATGVGLRSRAARRQLAQMAQVNPEAKAAAERLGVDLPVDILSDNAQVQSLAGLARSQVGSEAETAWRNVSAKLSQQADQALTDLGASTDLAQVSDDVMGRVNSTMQSLERQGAELRRGVDEAINVRDLAPVENLRTVLGEEIADLGGMAVARDALSAEEKKLLALLGENAQPPTYARLNRLRDDIGEALFKGKGPWADTSQANLARYYRALADDQLAYIEAKGGAELAEQMRTSNTLFSQMYDMRRDMQTLFGKQLEGSLVPLLNRALRQGSKGDAKALNQLLERVPADMQGPVLISTIMGQARSNAAHGGFSFANFTRLYRGLRENGPIYAKIAKSIGPEGERVLADLYAISRRMADGETKVLKTGKANQALASAIEAQSLVGGVLEATARRAVTGGTAAAGGAVGGPGGAFVGATIAENAQNAISRAGKSRLDRAHELLSSPEFRALADKLATGENTNTAVNRLVNSRGFNRFASMIGLESPEARRKWLTNLMAATGSQGAATFTRPDASIIEVVPQ